MSNFSLGPPIAPSTSYPLSSTDIQATANAEGSTASNKHIDAVATDFEAVFLSQMMGHMFEGDSTESYFGGGSTGEIYKSYLLNEYGKSMAKAGGIGIATQVKQELLNLQEVKP